MADNRRFIKLKKRKFSHKDFDHERTFGAGQAIFPKELLFLSRILDQGRDGACTAYASVAIRESMTQKLYDPQAQWKLELDYVGLKDADGVALNVPLEVARKKGFAPREGGEPKDKIGAYFYVSKMNGLDLFDSLRNVLVTKQVPLELGVQWFHEWDQPADGIVNIVSPKRLLGGHCVKICGLQTYTDGNPYLLVQGSWGKDYGDNGIWRFSRDVVNKHFGQFGIAYFSDLPPDEIGKLGLIKALALNAINLLQFLLEKLGLHR